VSNGDANDVAGIDRRTCLAAGATAGLAALAGCVSGSTEDRGEFEPDRAGAEQFGGCAEDEVVDDDFRLMGRAIATVFGSSAREWQIEIGADETLEVYVYTTERGARYGLPNIEIRDPDGNALVEARGTASNDHGIESDTGGTYTVRVSSRYLTENHDYRAVITWYDDTGCSTAV